MLTRIEDRRLFVSVLAAVEVRSAVRRRQFAGDIDLQDAALIIRSLVQETGRLIEHQLTAKVIAEATSLVDRHGLRALDSLQLATALVSRQTIHDQLSVIFVASDRKLLKAAEAEGFRVWDPSVNPFSFVTPQFEQ